MPFSGWRRLELVDQLLEALAVLGEVDRVGRGAEDRDAGGLERLGQLERRLAAELHDQAQQLAGAALDLDQLDHVLGGQRLEVQAVGGVVVGRHGLRIAVDHDGLVAGLAQRVDGMDAAIVELDALADAVRPAAQDDDLLPVGRLRLALRRPMAVALVAGIEVGRARFELGGAGVDALEHRPHAERPAALGDLGRRQVGELAQPVVGEALLLELEQRLGVLRQAVLADHRLASRRAARSGAGTTARTWRRAPPPRPTGRGGRPGRSPGCGRASAATARR